MESQKFTALVLTSLQHLVLRAIYMTNVSATRNEISSISHILILLPMDSLESRYHCPL